MRKTRRSPPPDLPPRFRARPDFSSLSVRDLLDAREAYHAHLSNKAHVVATAIGRYRIRKGDWYEKHPPGKEPPKGWRKPPGPRDLFNSVVTPWSWPCVLVFVDEWIASADWRSGRAGEMLEPDQFVPRSLFLPDGRVVPTCVVQLRRLETRPARRPPLAFPRQFVGGGYPVFTRVQGSPRIGSVGCLVTDGHNTYALTNRHVTGEEESDVFTLLGGTETKIGTTSSRVLGKRRFDQVWAPWPGSRVYLNLDVGLVKLADLSRWTTQVIGLGTLGGPVDLSPDTVSLDLVDQKVRAFGAVSGLLSGRISALFYRYHEVGGFEYVSDFLIAPDPGSETHPGDSGTLWCLDPPGGGTSVFPIALEWGGQRVKEAATGRARAFTLATSVSTLLRELELDLVRDWNIGLPEYWGALGHYTIAARATSAVAGNLQTLMEANLERISYPDARLMPGTFKGLSKKPFIPLADVPDYVWKIPGGPHRRPTESPSHFADMDKPLPDSPDKGKTLLQLSSDPKNLTPAFWNDYYTRVGNKSKGTLPFRVRQIYEEMVAAVKARKLDRFVAAAGIVAHYVGDTCQPLHISSLYDGDSNVLVDGKARGEGVHSAYESAMLNVHGPEILDGVTEALRGKAALRTFKGGQAAAKATVALMATTFRNLPPRKLVDAHAERKDLWPLFGPGTIATLVEGVRTLAQVWQSAWAEGNGNAIPKADLTAIPEPRLASLYSDDTFIPSLTLDDFVGTPTAPKGTMKAAGKGRMGAGKQPLV